MDSEDISAFLGERQISRRDLMRRGLLGGAGLASFGSLMALLEASGVSAAELEAKGTLAKLAAAAKKEGHLNTIALPPDWADYGEIISKFQSKYSVPITNASPDDTSAQENEAIVQLKGQDRAPDVVDVGRVAAKDGNSKGLYKAFKVSTWKTIPTNMKHPKGIWTGDYWGVQSFGVNLDVAKTAPKDWADLKSPKYKGMVAIDGDPRGASDAFSAVFAAALANGGSLNNIEPGIAFFADLKKSGNFILARASTANIVKGATPIAIKWDYLNLATRDGANGNPKMAVTIPKTGVYGDFYCQALSAFAPHPNAAKLWLEYLYSDAGQLMFLKGYTHPARYQDLVKRHKIPAALAKKLPPAAAYKKVKFATQAQIDAASKIVADQWGPKVAGS